MRLALGLPCGTSSSRYCMRPCDHGLPHYDPEISKEASFEEVASNAATPYRECRFHLTGKGELNCHRWKKFKVYLLKMTFPLTFHRGLLICAVWLPTVNPDSFLFRVVLPEWFLFRPPHRKLPQLLGNGTHHMILSPVTPYSLPPPAPHQRDSVI